MDTSSALIGLFITLLLAIPLIFVFRFNFLKNKNINEIKKKYSQHNHYKFDVTETSNKKIMAIDKEKKGLLFMDFNYKDTETTYFVDLNTIILCNTIIKKENNSRTITKIEIELVHKNSMKKEILPIYNIENLFLDVNCLYEDNKFAVKWTNTINDCLV